MARTRSNREESSEDTPSATDPERLIRDIRRSGRLLGSVGKHKANDKDHLVDISSEGNKEKNDGASDFDCNICFEVAKEPVVTCCGHLFCWPCLYQWLHVHCNYKECPVCKGKVSELDVVPIYGRGSSEAGGVRKNSEDGDQGLKIPPRPQGNRVESIRQQLRGSSLRGSQAQLIQQLFNELPENFQFLQRSARLNPPTPSRNIPSVLFDAFPETFQFLRRGDSGNSPTPARNLASVLTDEVLEAFQSLQSLQRGERGNPPTQPTSFTFDNLPASFQFPQRGERGDPPTQPSNIPSIPPMTTTSLQTETTSRQQNVLQSSDIEPQAIERDNTTRIWEQHATVTFSDDLPDPAPSPSQASTSSTMAMIQGEISVPHSSLEPERGGTSMVLRRRTRSRSVGSSRANEDGSQPRQRRRWH